MIKPSTLIKPNRKEVILVSRINQCWESTRVVRRGRGTADLRRRGGVDLEGAAREGKRGRRVRTFGDLEPGGHGGRELRVARWWRSVTASELDELAGVRSPAAAVGF